MEVIMQVVITVLADVYNTVDWSRAADFMSFAKEILGTCLLVASRQDDDKKDD